MGLQTNVSFYNSRTAMYAVYSLLTLAVFVVVSPYFVYQAIRYKKYIGSLRQRLGFLPISFNIDGEESIWIHAVSVGEVLTARAIAADLRMRYPRLRHKRSRFGQISVSIMMNSRGFTRFSVRRAVSVQSNGK